MTLKIYDSEANHLDIIEGVDKLMKRLDRLDGVSPGTDPALLVQGSDRLASRLQSYLTARSDLIAEAVEATDLCEELESDLQTAKKP